MEPDGLLPPVPEDQHEWLRPQFEGDEDRAEKMAAVFRWIGDIQQPLELVWPAEIDGELQRPPDAHLLDALVREYIFDCTDDPQLLGAAAMRPQARTVGVLDHLPACTECDPASPMAARYDSSYTEQAKGPWTYLCPEHFAQLGPGRLGSGIGQYLVTWDEVGPKTRAAFMTARQHWAARGVSLPHWLPWD